METLRRPGLLAVGPCVVMAAAWSLLALGRAGTAMPVLCGSAPDSPPLDLVLAVVSPATLAAAWVLMLAATMPALTVAPLRQLRRRNFARWRPTTSLLFAAGYAASWTAAGPVLGGFALALRLGPPPVAAGFALAAALAWQASPLKQLCLNRCHRDPCVTPFGLAAHRDALLFGLTHGAWCVGSCWALMALPLLAGRGHLAAMAAVAALLFAERLDPPAPPDWRWRVPVRAARIASARLRRRSALLAPEGETR